ncbi:hypothetical protein LOD99_11536 [Oopsacas minuta]|uniref:Uncharacterized protein n=1 Tax=Oopsacas minuta TaxID=111878 RepID=A0AAV7JK38_9METZ|nr:hypothetical protein LOD99_11536 [Oopsacas minuta]
MVDFVKEFSDISGTKVWIENRISDIKSKLDSRKASLFDSLDKIDSETKSNIEELQKLREYRCQTVSILGESAANIAVIDNKISEIQGRVHPYENIHQEGVISCIKLAWTDNQLIKLVSSLGDVELGVHESKQSPSRSLPIPALKSSVSLENLSPQKPPKPKRHVSTTIKKLGFEPSPVDTKKVSNYLVPDTESRTAYEIDSLEVSIEGTGTNNRDSVYTEMVGPPVGNTYYSLPNDGPELPQRDIVPPIQDTFVPPGSAPMYEDINDLTEEEMARLAQPSKPTHYPKYPIIVKCPEGTGSGCIMKPKTISVNPVNGNLYVVEKGNSRVQILTPNGDHVKFFVEKSNKMSNPYGICFANNHVYVTQSTLNCIYIFTPNGAFVKKFGKEGTTDGRFSLPSCMTALPSKRLIYICDTGNNRIQIFDFSTNFQRLMGVGQLLKPVDIACDSTNKIVVLDRSLKCLHVFGQSGDLLYSTISFSLHKQISNPLFMTLSKHDDVFLSDYARNCVFIFSIDGVMKGQIGAEGVFVEPRGLVFDSTNRLVVLSCNHSGCLQFFDVI